tara:strand:- start:64 stop:696 length:633 start_codon:yes stop_codon:yes gene_type:complete
MADNLNQSILNKARADKFLLSFTVPKCLKDIATTDERSTHHKSRRRVMPDSVQYAIYGMVVPEISIPSVEIPYSGQHMKVSGHVRDPYGDVSVDFNIDNQFSNYWYMWRWLDILNDHKLSSYDATRAGTSNERSMEGLRSASHLDPDIAKDYQADFTLFGLNEYNKRTVEFTYTKAFPISLGEIGYDYQDSSEITSSFTFSFSQLLVNLL